MNFKRTPFWLWPVVIGVVGGLIASAIFWLYFLIPASVTKAKRQAMEQKQKVPEPAKEEEQKPQQPTRPQTKGAGPRSSEPGGDWRGADRRQNPD